MNSALLLRVGSAGSPPGYRRFSRPGHVSRSAFFLERDMILLIGWFAVSILVGLIAGHCIAWGEE